MTPLLTDERPIPRLNDPSEVASPALVVDRRTVESNLATMLRMAGGPTRLRPHVKTHKMPGLIELATRLGIVKHKCATIAEAEMVAEAGGVDILIAYPMIGPNLERIARLVRTYQGRATFRATVDAIGSAEALSETLEDLGLEIAVLIDLDVGMHRTGIAPGPEAQRLADQILELPALQLDGLHGYDGHIRVPDPQERRDLALRGQEGTFRMAETLRNQVGRPMRLVVGGTPTFPVYAGLDLEGLECSPGTMVLHDANYLRDFPDLPFHPAAALLTRIVSRPRADRICLDLGHKAVAADPPGPALRMTFPGHDELRVVGQSEEHLMVEVDPEFDLPVGTPLYAIPSHICPTSALHQHAVVVEDGHKVDLWPVSARDRILRI